MKLEQRIRLYSVCLLLLVVVGCSNHGNSSKPSTQELQAFRGDPSKMPASVQQQIAKQQSDAMKKALASQAANMPQKGAQ